MQAPDVVRAIRAAVEVASELDFAATEARVLHNSNKLNLRLLPCDVVARVAFAGLEDFEAELEIGRRLAEVEAPWRDLSPESSRVSISGTGPRSRSGSTASL